MKITLDFDMSLGPFGPKTAMAYAERVEFALRKAANIVKNECIEEDFFGFGIPIRKGNELVAEMNIEEDPE